jgi:hypothetical protein
MKGDPNCLVPTMVDYYGLPQDGQRAWLGRADAGRVTVRQKASLVEEALRNDLANEIGDARGFIPFVVMHEFEALLFSDCPAFGRGIARPELQSKFQSIRDQFATPEDIDDSPETAPSKRVENLVPGYQKPLLGTLAILEIGLGRIRAECPRFDDWLRRLEALAR